jgi:hypothetical protein
MNIEINTDEEMKQVNDIVRDLFNEGKPVLIVNLRTGETSGSEIEGKELKERVMKALHEREALLFKKRCKNPENCKVGEWHNAIIIAEGDVFPSWDASQAVAEMTMLRMLGGLLGGSDGRREA